MTLKIERISDGRSATIRLIGRMSAEHLEELRAQINSSGPKLALDLEEVSLVDLEVVRFLGICQLDGLELLHCSPYIRNWIAKEQVTVE
jgi:anti-anti-sigma regulatory factor